MILVECRYTAGPNVTDVGADVPRWVDPESGIVYEDALGNRRARTMKHIAKGGVFATGGGSVLKPVANGTTHVPGKALDTQVGGGHYKDMRIQPVEFIVANNIKYREANAIKYVCRHEKKNGVEDLKKAAHYIQMLIDEYEAKAK